MIESDKYVVIDLIGSHPDESGNTNKIDGYYQPANGFLIRGFAINFLGFRPKNVKILAYGNEKDYNIYIHTNNKCYYQIDLNNFFQIDINSSKIDFVYFTHFNDALKQINDIISKNNKKRIILFLDDHGYKRYFSKILYFQLYEIIMKYPDNYFLIFNDSCFSGSFIELIQAYNYMHSLILSHHLKDINLHVLFSFKNIFIYNPKNLDNIRSIEEVTQLINFIQSIKIHNDSMLKMIMNLNIPQNVKPDEQIFNGSNDQNLSNVFHSVKELLDFRMIINSCYNSDKMEKDESFENYKNVFNLPNLEFFVEISNKDLIGLVKKLDTLYITRNDINFRLSPHKNIEIITSTDNENECLSFASIRTNDVIKIYPGSPAMGSFIKEVFLKEINSPINFDNIKKEITELDGKPLYYPMRIKQKRNSRKKKHWTHLYPEHYKEGECTFSLQYTDKMKRKVAALRAISILNVKKLTEAAKSLTNETTIPNINPFNDSCADIVAIIALLNNYNGDKTTIINECINQNDIIIDHEPQGIEPVSLIIKLPFQISKTPLNLIGITINILEHTAKKVIFEKIIFSIDNKRFDEIFTANEANILLKKINKIQKNSLPEEDKTLKFYSSISNKEKYKFVFDIEKAIIALMQQPSIFFAIFIATYYSNEMNEELIKSLASDYLGCSLDKSFQYFFDDDKDFLKNEGNDKKERKKHNKEIAEHYLLAHVNKTLNCINLICNAQIKSDAMKIVANQFKTANIFTLIFTLIDILDEKDNSKSFMSIIIDKIDESITNNDISNFFIPTIIAFLHMKTVIYALYISLSYLQKDWYKELLKKLEPIEVSEKYNSIYQDIIFFTKKALKKQKDIESKEINDKEVKKMDNYIYRKVQKSINKIQKLIEISIKKARGNISKRININFVNDQINSYFDYFPEQFDKNKIFSYISSSINELSQVKNYNDFTISINDVQQNKIIIDDELIIDTKNIFKRASDELRTVAYLFEMSNPLLKESDKFNDQHAIKFSVNSMTARTFNIVEMAPITSELDIHFDKFNPSEGLNPNLRELMGLQSAIMHILPDKKRARFKTEPILNDIKDTINYNTEIRKYEVDDIDSYYSSNYHDSSDSISFDIDENNDMILIKKPISIFNQPSIEKYQKFQISKFQISMISEELKLGRSDWKSDAWKTFVYCFNLRLENIKVQFDPNDEYNEITYPISIIDGIDIILKFYPLTSVLDFWENKYKIERFVGKYTCHAKRIIQAFIQSFDDVDHIVTPLYMSTETYRIRSLDTLKLIYDYKTDESE